MTNDEIIQRFRQMATVEHVKIGDFGYSYYLKLLDAERPEYAGKVMVPVPAYPYLNIKPLSEVNPYVEGWILPAGCNDELIFLWAHECLKRVESEKPKAPQISIRLIELENATDGDDQRRLSASF